MASYPVPERLTSGGVAVFADSHLGEVEGDASDFLSALEEVLERGLTTAVLLGDIFRYFIGDRKFETPLVRKVTEGWESLSRRGLRIRYIEGNRDFFVGGSPWAAHFSRYGLTDGIEIGGKRFAFVHGDGVNTDDLPYRFWRRLSKNPVSYVVMKSLPGPLARSIVRRTEARLYQTNFRHKRRLPERYLLQEGAKARGAGFDHLLVGHFHVDRVFQSDGASVRILPAWLEERRHAEIGPDGCLTLVTERTAGSAGPRRIGE